MVCAFHFCLKGTAGMIVCLIGPGIFKNKSDGKFYRPDCGRVKLEVKKNKTDL